VKTAKEELIRRIKLLEQSQAVQKKENDQLKEEHVQLQDKLRTFAEIVVKNENSGKSVESLLVQMKGETGQSYQDLINILNEPSLYASTQASTGSVESLDNGLYSGSDVDMDSDGDSTQMRWTTVTNDDALVDHLMLLYFTWVHPVHMLFNESHFVSSLKSRSLTYCTPALINAICAMGCCFMADEQGNNTEAKKYGDRFAQQVHAELKNESQMTPVSAVTYAILFLVELSAGQARTAFSHLRLAVESLRTVDRANWSDEAFEITAFGLHTLNT
jgi:hypothetical protein